jgi:hypothetical protein
MASDDGGCCESNPTSFRIAKLAQPQTKTAGDDDNVQETDGIDEVGTFHLFRCI